jgi:ferrous iron transport protein A
MGIQNADRSLAQLGVGERGRIAALEGSGPIAIRLLEMGLVPGAEVAVLKRAPMGDPLEIRVRDYHLSLRRGEAERVRLEGGNR